MAIASCNLYPRCSALQGDSKNNGIQPVTTTAERPFVRFLLNPGSIARLNNGDRPLSMVARRHIASGR